MHSTKQRLIDAGLRMLLEQGYGSLGIQALLNATKIPKGSFYHHFQGKEDFALAVIDSYLSNVHTVLDACVGDTGRPPLERIRHFFELVQQSYAAEGYLGCLMGGLGQELSGASDVFREKIEWCFSTVALRLETCLQEAQRQGDIPGHLDTRHLADLLVNCWEGAALRSRLTRSPESLDAMLDFYLRSLA